MTSLAPSYNFTALDFPTIKQSLRAYLSTRPEFLDTDWTGSTANLILDILSYNSQGDAFYANMLASEFFLSTAQLRENIVSRANELGYVTASATSSQAIIDANFTINNKTQTALVIPAGTIFTSSVNDTTYKFQTQTDYTSSTYTSDGTYNTFQFTGISIYEGSPLVLNTTIDETNIGGVVIPNAAVDMKLIKVTVDGLVFTEAGNIVNIQATDNVYFIEEINDELYRVYFGDNKVGTALSLGQNVVIDYLVCNEDAPNGASVFTLASTVTNVTSMSSYTTQSPAFGGAAIQDKEEVRLLAPIFNAAQNRAVTPNDYVAIINANYSGFRSVIAWGGQDNVPQVLGYVFISIIPVGRLALTNDEKFEIEQDLANNYSVVTVVPIIVDPEYLYIIPTITVYYNPSLISVSLATLTTTVTNTVVNYNTSDLDTFNQYFRYSKLSRLIDASDISINNNTMTTYIERRVIYVFPLAVVPLTILNFANQIEPFSITSNTFGYGASTYAIIADDGVGTLSVYISDVNGTKPTSLTSGILASSVGTVDYTSGKMTLNSFNPASANSITGDIRVRAQQIGQDIYPTNNTALNIDNISVTVVADTIN